MTYVLKYQKIEVYYMFGVNFVGVLDAGGFFSNYDQIMKHISCNVIELNWTVKHFHNQMFGISKLWKYFLRFRMRTI